MRRLSYIRGLALIYIWAQIDAYMLPMPMTPGKDQGLPARGHGRKVDYYKVLEIKPNSNTAAIKKAYRQRAKTTHPDLNANAGQQDFLLVKEAYQVLSNPEMRATYDRRRNIGVGFGIAETLAIDFVVPMAKDVAIPLVKEVFNGVVKDIAEPLAKMAVEQAQRPFKETAAYLEEKRQQVTAPITETVAYLDEKKRQVEHMGEVSAAYLEQKRQEIEKPILETLEQGHLFVERSAAFVNQTMEPLVHSMEQSAALIDETTRMVTEPLASTAAFIDEKKRQVSEPIMHGVEVSSAFLQEAGRQVSEPIMHGVEASGAFLQETHNQVAVPILHTIEVSGAAIKEAQRQVSEPIMHSIEVSGAAIKEAQRQVTEPIMHTVEASSAFLHETQRQVTEPIVEGVQRSAAMVGHWKHRLLTGANEFKQLEATRRSEQLRQVETATRDFLDQSRALLTSWGAGATSSTRRALADFSSATTSTRTPPSTSQPPSHKAVQAPSREASNPTGRGSMGNGSNDLQHSVFGIVTTEGSVRRAPGEARGQHDQQK